MGDGEDLGLLGVLLADEVNRTDPLTLLLGVIVRSTIRIGLLEADLDLKKFTILLVFVGLLVLDLA